MARNAKDRQRVKIRKDARRREHERDQSHDGREGNPPTGLLQHARRVAVWPLMECWIQCDWRDEMSLSTVVVTRQGPNGQVALGNFLVDLACLGAKNGFASVFPSQAAYERLRDLLISGVNAVPCDLSLAAKVVHEGIRYARSLGFEPHPDARDTLPMLRGAGPCNEEVPLGGRDGRPLFMQGPDDDVRHILATLDRTVGRNAYGVILQDSVPPYA